MSSGPDTSSAGSTGPGRVVRMAIRRCLPALAAFAFVVATLLPLALAR